MRELWNFNSPKEVFESYNREVDLYQLKKRQEEKLGAQIEGLQKKIDKNKREWEQLEARTIENNKSYQVELEAKNNKALEREKKALNAEAKDFEALRAELLKEKNREFEQISLSYQEKIDSLNKNANLSVDALSPRAEKALEIEGEKQSFFEEVYLRQRGLRASYAAEVNEAELEIAEKELEIARLLDEYEPKIADFRKKIGEKIAEKEGALTEFNRSLAEEESSYEAGFQALELEGERLRLQDPKSEAFIEAYSSFEVRRANQEKTSKEGLNAKKTALQSALAEAEAQLGHLKSELGKLIKERDGEFEALDERIQELRKNERSRKAELLLKLEEAARLREEKDAELEKKVLSYARSQELDHSSNYDRLLGRFKSLQAKSGLWRALIAEIGLKNSAQDFEIELVRQRQKLDKMSYEQLEQELVKAEGTGDKLSLITKKPLPFTISAVFVSVFGLIVFGLSFLKGIAEPVLQMWIGIGLVVLGLIFLFYVLTKPRKDLKRFSRFISLAEDNESFDVIEKRAISDTEDEEVSSLKEQGLILWLRSQGEGGLLSQKKAKEEEVETYYEQLLHNLEKKYENKKTELSRVRRLEAHKNELNLFLDKNIMNLSLLSHQKDLKYSQSLNEAYNSILEDLKGQREELTSDRSSFEADYSELLNKVKHRDWTEFSAEPKPGLEPYLYLPYFRGDSDKNSLIEIMKLSIQSGPILITYDNYLLDHEGNLMPEELSSLILNLVQSFYRLNSSVRFGQYLYSEAEGLKGAMNSGNAESYNLRMVLEGEGDLEKLSPLAAEDNTILYYVFKAQDVEGRIVEGLLEALKAKTAKDLIVVYIAYQGAVEDARNSEEAGYKKLYNEASFVLKYSNLSYQIEKQ